MTDIEKEILKDRIMFCQTALEVFVIDYMDTMGLDPDLIGLGTTANRMLTQLKDKIEHSKFHINN